MQQWIVNLIGGPKRVNHSAVSIGDKIYSFGGYCSEDNYSDMRPIDVHILNTVNLKWKVYYPPKELPHEAPFQRYGHTSVAYGSRVFIWGGRNDQIACNELFCFDTDKLRWKKIKTSGLTPGARDGHSACIIEDHMYIFGGFEDLENQFSQQIYKIDLNTFFWSAVITKGEKPGDRDFHTATAFNNKMYVFGGRGDQHAPAHTQTEIYSNVITYLDVKTNYWCTPTVTGVPPSGRRSHSAVVYKDHIYIFGGYNSLSRKHFNDVHRFNPETFCWQEIKPLGVPPCKRRRHSCVVVGSWMCLFGGTSPDSSGERDNDQGPKLTDHSDLHILDFEPTLKIMCLASVISHKLDTSCLPLTVRQDIETMSTDNVIIKRIPSNG